MKSLLRKARSSIDSIQASNPGGLGGLIPGGFEAGVNGGSDSPIESRPRILEAWEA